MAPPLVGIDHAHMAGFQVEVGLQQQAQWHRLRPRVAFDLETQGVVIHLAMADAGFDAQGVAQDAWFKGGDRLVDQGSQGLDINAGNAVARQRRQAVIDH